jgi:hypothetical protein
MQPTSIKCCSEPVENEPSEHTGEHA